MKKIILAVVACFVFGASIHVNAFDIKGFLTGIVEEATETDEFKLSDLEGSWDYYSPAVNLESDNAISEIGGSAANASIEEKLSPYYDRLGLNKMTMTFDKDANFTIKIKKITLSGVVTRNEKGALVFEFKPLAKIPMGKIAAKATKNINNTLELTFDATKFVKLVQTISSYANNATIDSLSAIIDNYNGIYLGAKMKKSK